MRRLLAAAAVFVLAACSDPTLSTDDWVRAGSTGDATLAITNRGSEPVYVRVSDPTELDIQVGCSPQTCTRINPNQILRVPYTEIINWDPGDAEAAVNWWVFADDGSTRDTGTVVARL